jgi:serine/threonine protein kinase
VPISPTPPSIRIGVPATTDDRRLGGRYRLGESLGHGGMGVVWAGRDELLGRDVAVKEVVPPHDLAADDRERLFRRTLREARAAARISSAAAVTVFDVVEEDGRPWIVMERLAARSLADVIAEEARCRLAARRS